MAEGIQGIKSGGLISRAYGGSSLLDGGFSKVSLNDSSQSTFIDMVKEATQNSMDTMRNADVVSQQGIRGEVSIQEVVQATMAAEASLQTVVSVRDRLVSAYQEILRMPI